MITITIDKSPLTEVKDWKLYIDRYKCLPVPLFIIITSFIQVMMFVYNNINNEFEVENIINSAFIYRSDKRVELWRFISYATLHTGWVHLTFNTLVQALIGLPLEMVHGSLRVGCLYLAGVVAGSLGTSVFEADVYLVGASGGVYALLAAHLANVLINYSIMQFACLRLLAVAFIATTDMGFAVYDNFTGVMVDQPVSYIAHLTGALAGLSLGLIILNNFSEQSQDNLLWWISLGILTACFVFAFIFNMLHPFPYIGIRETMAT